MITDNVLITFECLHAIRTGNKKCKSFGAYKLDITKGYDRVESWKEPYYGWAFDVNGYSG
jgi:hypothetical protein